MIEITIPSGQNAGMYIDIFVCDTVKAMDTCVAQQATWHPATDILSQFHKKSMSYATP